MTVDKGDLEKALGLFLALEIEQVGLYEVQAAQTFDEHTAMALKHFKKVEQGHVENIRAAFTALGGKPGLLAAISPAVGRIAGHITEVTGLVNLLRANITIETIASRHYRYLIDRVEDPALRELLFMNMIDEELHRAWMIDKVAELTGAAEDKK